MELKDKIIEAFTKNSKNINAFCPDHKCLWDLQFRDVANDILEVIAKHNEAIKNEPKLKSAYFENED
jgi:hypothetical protein